MEMKVFAFSLLICACLAHEEHARAPSSPVEDRWFNDFHGPNLYFGSHSQPGQHDRHHAASDYEHSYEHDRQRRHHYYVNLEACECVYVIDRIRTAKSLDKGTIPTTETKTAAADKFNEEHAHAHDPIPIHVLSGLKSEDDDRLSVDFYNGGLDYLQHSTDHQFGANFDFDDDDPTSSSSEEFSDSQEDVWSSGENLPNGKPDNYISKNEYIKYGRQPGFRNPFTGVCMCLSTSHAKPGTRTTKSSDSTVTSSHASKRTHSPNKPSPATAAATYSTTTPRSSVSLVTITAVTAPTLRPATSRPSTFPLTYPTATPTKQTTATSQSTKSSGSSATLTAPVYTPNSPQTSTPATVTFTPPSFPPYTRTSASPMTSPTVTYTKQTSPTSHPSKPSGLTIPLTATTSTPQFTRTAPATTATVASAGQTTKSSGYTATPIPVTPSRAITTASPRYASGSSPTYTSSPSQLTTATRPITVPTRTTSKISTVTDPLTAASLSPKISTATTSRVPIRTWHWYTNTNGY